MRIAVVVAVAAADEFVVDRLSSSIEHYNGGISLQMMELLVEELVYSL